MPQNPHVLFFMFQFLFITNFISWWTSALKIHSLFYRIQLLFITLHSLFINLISWRTHMLFSAFQFLTMSTRYMTWVAQVIGHDVPSPKLPDFLGIGHIKPKVCPDIRIGICSLKLYADIWANFGRIWPIPKKTGSFGLGTSCPITWATQVTYLMVRR